MEEAVAIIGHLFSFFKARPYNYFYTTGEEQSNE
jgi:hypothetical protein